MQSEPNFFPEPSPVSTLSTKLGSITFCFSISVAASTVTKKMLIPDSLASLEASSTWSVGHPSTTTTTTFGAPPRFPLASKKKFLLTNESAFPGIKEEMRMSYRSGSTLPDNTSGNGGQRADSSSGALPAAGESGFSGCASRREGCWCQCQMPPVLSYAEAHPSLPCVPQGLEWQAGLARIPDMSCSWGERWILSTCDVLTVPWTSTGRSWREWYLLSSAARGLSTVQSQPPHPVRCGLSTAQALEPSLSWGCASSPITYQRWKVHLSVGFSQWRFLGPWSWYEFLS